MDALIRELRLQLKINQEKLAVLLGVSPVTVNRWENGRAKPSLMAQRQLYGICCENRLDLVDYLIKREPAGRSLRYHASRTGLVGKIQPKSRAKCDFGRGFYTGTDPLQPLTLVCNEDAPVFYTLDFDTTGLKLLDVAVGIDWAMLIAYYRGYMAEAAGTPLYEKYAHMADGFDVIAGYIANDRMYQVLTDFFEGRITDAALVASLSALKLGRQYVAKSQRACDRIKIVKERRLSRLELMLLLDKSEARRREGKSLADRMVRLHRRDGRYFDEILRGVEP